MLNIPPGINTSFLSLRNLLQLMLAFVAVGCHPRYSAGTLSSCSHLPPFTKLSFSKLSPFCGRFPPIIHPYRASLNLSIQNGDLTFRLLSFFICLHLPDVKGTLSDINVWTQEAHLVVPYDRSATHNRWVSFLYRSHTCLFPLLSFFPPNGWNTEIPTNLNRHLIRKGNICPPVLPFLAAGQPFGFILLQVPPGSI